LLEVDDVDPVPLAEDVLAHLRVPSLRLMAEVNTRLQELLDADRLQMILLYRFENWNRARAPRCPYFLRSLTRESRVRNPACFSRGFRLASNTTSARARP